MWDTFVRKRILEDREFTGMSPRETLSSDKSATYKSHMQRQGDISGAACWRSAKQTQIK